MTTSIAELSALVAGTVLEPGQPGYDQEVAGFNAAVVHRAELVVGASSQEDVLSGHPNRTGSSAQVPAPCSPHALIS